MRKVILTGLVILVALSLIGGSPTVSLQPASHPQLRLHRGTFDAQQINPQAGAAALAVAAPGSYTIIQLRGPIIVADRTALEQTSVKLLEYLPDYAYLV